MWEKTFVPGRFLDRLHPLVFQFQSGGTHKKGLLLGQYFKHPFSLVWLARLLAFVQWPRAKNKVNAPKVKNVDLLQRLSYCVALRRKSAAESTLKLVRDFPKTYNANTVLSGKLRAGGGASFLAATGESTVPVIVARAVAALELGFIVGSLI